VPSIGSYFISRAVLGAPPDGISTEILLDQMPTRSEEIGRLLTSPGAAPWDVVSCRQGTAGRLAVLDAACVFASIGTLDCHGTLSFSSSGAMDKNTTGLSNPDTPGRWSVGPIATLTCNVLDTQPVNAYFGTSALVAETHTQRMSVSINGQPGQVFEYSVDSPSKEVKIVLPPNNGRKLVFRFEFPDAVSPQELGMSTDGRELAVMMHYVRFE